MYSATPLRWAPPSGAFDHRFQGGGARWIDRVVARLVRGTRRQAATLLAGQFIGAACGGLLFAFGQLPWDAAIGGGASLGLALGLCVGVGREFTRNAIGMSTFAKSAYAVLGAAPELAAEKLRELPPDQRTPMGSVLLQPATAFATAMRQLERDLGNARLVAFVAPAPETGATTAALCTAIGAAQRGRSVIAIDCDVRRRTLTQAVGARQNRGVLYAAEYPEQWRDIVHHEPESGVDVLPAERVNNPWQGLADSEGLPALIEQLRLHYDLIVLDCPPALSADGAAIAPLADRCVLVANWDETPVGALNDALRALGRIGPAVAGVFVNRAPSRVELS